MTTVAVAHKALERTHLLAGFGVVNASVLSVRPPLSGLFGNVSTMDATDDVSVPALLSGQLASLGIKGEATLRALGKAAHHAVVAVKKLDALLASHGVGAHFFVSRIFDRESGEVRDRLVWTTLVDRMGVVDPEDRFSRDGINLLVPHAYKHARLSRVALRGVARSGHVQESNTLGGATGGPLSPAGPASTAGPVTTPPSSLVDGPARSSSPGLDPSEPALRAPSLPAASGQPGFFPSRPPLPPSATPPSPSPPDGLRSTSPAALTQPHPSSSTHPSDELHPSPPADSLPSSASGGPAASSSNAEDNLEPKIYSKSQPATLRPNPSVAAIVTEMSTKAQEFAKPITVFKAAASWCVTALMVAMQTNGRIRQDMNLAREGRRGLMSSLRERWWPCWQAPIGPLGKRSATKPPDGTSGAIGGSGADRIFSVWGLRVDTGLVRASVSPNPNPNPNPTHHVEDAGRAAPGTTPVGRLHAVHSSISRFSRGLSFIDLVNTRRVDPGDGRARGHANIYGINAGRTGFFLSSPGGTTTRSTSVKLATSAHTKVYGATVGVISADFIFACPGHSVDGARRGRRRASSFNAGLNNATLDGDTSDAAIDTALHGASLTTLG